MRRLLLVPFVLSPWGLAVGLPACGASTQDSGGDAGHDAGGASHGDAAVTPSDEGGHADEAGHRHDAGHRADAPAPPDAGRDASADARRDALAEATADVAPDGPFVTATHPPLPELINFGAPGPGVLTAPQVVTVTFPGDTMAKDFEELGKGIASSTWWNEIRPGFCDSDAGPCMGDGPPGVSVKVTTPPAASYTDAELRTWLKDQIDTGVLPMPGPGSLSQTIYVLYFPQSTVITSSGTSCTDFFGYHGKMSYTDPADAGGKKQQVTYAVVDECTQPEPDGGVTAAYTLAFTTETASHEIVEASTDPVNGFYLDLDDPSTWGWNDVLGGEAADLCDWYGGPPNYPYWPLENVPYNSKLTVQRIWSNAQVAAGLDPCLPVPSGVVFFEVAPEQNVFVLDVGGSVTFPAYAYSTARTSGWTIIPEDMTPTTKYYLDFKVAGATSTDGGPTLSVNNGDVVSVTMKLLADPHDTPNGEADGALISYAGSADFPTAAYLWPFVVMTPADAMRFGIDASVTTRPVHKHTPGWTFPRTAASIRGRGSPPGGG
jgi:hypothetical protein